MVFHASTLPFLICYCSFVPCKPLAADQSVCGNTLCVSSFKVDAEKRATCWRDLVDLHSNCWRDSRERIEGWLGGGFKYWSFSSLFGVSWSNLTCAYFSDGLKLNHQLVLMKVWEFKNYGDLNRSSQVNVELMGSMETQGLFWYACQKSDTQQPGMDTLQYFGKECLGPTNVPRTESHVNFVRNFWGATWIRWTRSSVKCLGEWKHGKRFNLEHTCLVPAFGWAIIKNHDPWWWQCQDKPRPSVVHRRKCEGDSCAAVGKAALESTALQSTFFFGLTRCS